MGINNKIEITCARFWMIVFAISILLASLIVLILIAILGNMNILPPF